MSIDYARSQSLNVVSEASSSSSSLSGNLSSSNSQLIKRKLLMANRKCWLCFAMLPLSDEDNRLVESFFLSKPTASSLRFASSATCGDRIQLRMLHDSVVMSMCKCRKKLAHKDCFDRYIDYKQAGDIHTHIPCLQCKCTYEFEYGYNTTFLKVYDCLESALSGASCVLATLLLALTAYWCCFSYSAISLIQLYGFENAIDLMYSTNKLIVGLCMPLMPVGLIAGRFLAWENYIISLMTPFSFGFVKGVFIGEEKLKSLSHRKSRGRFTVDDDDDGGDDDQDDEHKNNASYKRAIRLILGGLTLPTIAMTLDKLVVRSVFSVEPSLWRTILVAAGFVSIKGFVRVLYWRRKSWHKAHRDIQDYGHNR